MCVEGVKWLQLATQTVCLGVGAYSIGAKESCDIRLPSAGSSNATGRRRKAVKAKDSTCLLPHLDDVQCHVIIRPYKIARRARKAPKQAPPDLTCSSGLVSARHRWTDVLLRDDPPVKDGGDAWLVSDGEEGHTSVVRNEETEVVSPGVALLLKGGDWIVLGASRENGGA